MTKRSNITTALLASIAAVAIARNAIADDIAWYGVSGDHCTSLAPHFDPEVWARQMRREGATVVDKGLHNTDGAAEFMVSYKGETKPILFYRGREDCNNIVSIIRSTGPLPWEMREEMPQIRHGFFGDYIIEK